MFYITLIFTKSQSALYLRRRLLGLKSVIGKLQRPTVLGHNAHDLLVRPVGETGFDFERDLHFRAELADQMRDHLFGDTPGITTNTGWVEGDGTIKAARHHRLAVGGAGASARTAGVMER